MWVTFDVVRSLLSLLEPVQVDERYRKNLQGSPQTAAAPKQPPLPPRSSEPYSNGAAPEAPAMHRPMEPQVPPPLPPHLLLLFLLLFTSFLLWCRYSGALKPGLCSCVSATP